MKVAINWLKELIDLNISIEKLIRLLNLKTIAAKQVTKDYIELDMKGYNRPDLLSLRGVALEIEAITESKIKFKDTPETEYIWVGQNLPSIHVMVENVTLAPVYCIAKIEGLKVNKSPDVWVKKIEASGFRPVNNIADVTNLIMVEYGQPLHAFDAKKVSDQTLVVRCANKGEKLLTLDEKQRQLQSSDLLIADSEKPLGLAGIMGGKDSEVSKETTAILLEAAIFDANNLRRSTQRLGLQSEAAKRFQHGLTKTRLLQALDAAVRMYQQMGGKLTALTIHGDFVDANRQIKFKKDKLLSLIGIDLADKQIEALLNKLHFHLASQGDALEASPSPSWVVEVPYWRLDVDIEEDVVEEVARMYGYDKIPSKPLQGKPPQPTNQSKFEHMDKIKQDLVKLGLTQVQTYSFYSTEVLKNTGKEKYLEHFIKVANPISSETEYLRCDLWPNLVEVVTRNFKHEFKDVAVFEIGKVYLLENGGSINEKYNVAIALMNGSDNPVAELYQIISHLRGVILGSSKPDEYAKGYFHPTRSSFLEKDGKVVGGIAEVHPRIINKFGVNNRVAVAEVELQ